MDNFTKPKFQVGDVVSHIYESIPNGPLYFIRDVIYPENSNISSEYCYDTSHIDAPDEIKRFYESVLEFQYHDNNWEEYAESVRTNLPAWRGRLYNIINIYDNPYVPDGSLNNDEASLYNKNTLPPHRMSHIINEHTVCQRIGHVTSINLNPKNAAKRIIICNNLNVEDAKIKTISRDVRDKIAKINLKYSLSNNKDTLQYAISNEFTEQEIAFLNLIDELDMERVSEKGKKKDVYKDHFPLWMSYYQIMECIKDAYTNPSIFKVGDRRYQSSNKKDTNGNVIELDAPIKGKCNYESYSNKYKLPIKILYNFDYDFIETAYPLGKNRNIIGPWK